MTAATNNLESGNVTTYIAGAAIPVHSCVMYSTTVEGEVLVTTGITVACIGVALNTAAAGEQVQIQTGGVAAVLTSGICTLAVGVVPGANGKCVTEAAAGATAMSFGIAEQTTTTDGTVLRVRLGAPNRRAPNT